MSKKMPLTSSNENNKSIIARIRQTLKECSDVKTRETGQHYFKEKIKLYGVKTDVVTKISKEYFAHIKQYDKEAVFALCDEFWQSGYMEESFIACNWSYFKHRDYTEGDFRIFEKWITSYVGNWASCDTLCNHTVGAFIELFPHYLSNLKKWARSDNRWVRRGSAVSLIVPARKGMFLNDIFKIADLLLVDRDDMVQKGYGWMLKVASQTHEKEVFDYVMKNKKKMPRTALRYAIEKMSSELKKQAMEKEKSGKLTRED